jgi:t-SNARE complex subunit (syntaxin)
MRQWTPPQREKGKHMAEPQETRQEQETRWATQRAAQNKEVQEGRKARQKNRRTWVTVAVIVILTAVIATVCVL